MFTALLIAILIVAGAATVVGGGLVLAAQRRKALGSGEAVGQLTSGTPRLLERTVRNLRPGDIIQRDGRDYLVEGTVSFDEDGHRWVAGRLVDADTELWLVVGMERAGSASMRLMELDRGVEVSGYPPEALDAGGTRYALAKRGTATARMSGDVAGLGGADPSRPESVVRCRWWRYEAAGAGSLIVEQWGGDFRVLRGSEITDADLEMIPGS